MKLILASSSPRRQELLKKITEDFEVRPAEIEEVVVDSRSARENAERLAAAKARAVFTAGTLTIGCDTLGEIDGEPFGKPRDEAAAVKLLKKLSGKTHTVVSAFCLKNDEKEVIGSAAAKVTFRELTDSEIQNYVANNPVTGFAGGYAIQGPAGKFVAKVEGETETVIGFPLKEIQRNLALLKNAKPEARRSLF